MSSLLDILQGHQPEELGREPTATIESMFDILMELATSSESSEISNASSSEDGRTIRALSGTKLSVYKSLNHAQIFWNDSNTKFFFSIPKFTR